MMRRTTAALAGLLLGVFLLAPAAGGAEKKKVVFIAGRPSHGFLAHDHRAGCHLLAKRLNESGLPIEAVVVENPSKNGWPDDPKVFDGAAAIVIYADGGDGHPANKNLELLDQLLSKGVGFGCIHYGVETVKGAPGDAFLKGMGGYFEINWSVNPHWIAEYKELPKHDVTRGVKPFTTNDEWYYNMRFREGMNGVTPILQAVPPDSTRSKPFDAHGGNEYVRSFLGKNHPEITTWVATREGNDGRGFGTTGGHWHRNWAQDDYRTLILNSIAWIAHVDVPEGGVPNKRPDVDEMLSNHDEKIPEGFNRQNFGELLKQINEPRKESAAAAK